MSFIENIKKDLFDFYRKAETKIHPLKSILWECTLKCNLNCGHCGSDCKSISNIPDADEKLLYKALKDISSSFIPSDIMIGITGGEPLMRKDLPDIINKIHNMGFLVGMVSNGFALTPQKFTNFINNGLNSLSISLDGLENEHNELRKHKMSFANAMIAIKNAAGFIKQSQGRNNFIFDVVTCVHPLNINTLPQVKKILKNAGVENWRLFSIFPSGRANDKKYELSAKQYRQLLDFITEAKKDNDMNINYSCEGWLGNYELKARDSYYFCRAGITNAGIFIDGSVGGCISIRSKDFIVGNLKDKSFMEIWNNDFNIYRNRIWTKKGKCAECKEYKHCLGNGLHLYNSIDSMPARCSLPL